MKHVVPGILGLSLSLVLAACSARAPAKLNGTTTDDPRPAADFTLTDQDGSAFHLADAKGKVVVLTFLYTHCTDICPFVALKIKEAIPLLGADAGKTVFVAVTTDPARDTVEAVASYSRQAGLSAGWHFLTGDAAAVRQVWSSYGIGVTVESEKKGAASPRNGESAARFVAPTQGLAPVDLDSAGRLIGAFAGGYEVSHTTPIIFIDPKGRLRAVMDPDALPSEIAQNVKALLGGG